jgi:hypothetical protein
MPDGPPLWDDGPLDDQAPAGGRRVGVGGLSPSGSAIATRQLRRTTRLEENFLRQCLEHPGALPAVNYQLTRLRMPEVAAADFGRAEDRALLAEIARRATLPTVATIAELCDSLDSALAQRVRTLLVAPPAPATKLDRLPEALALSVLDWRLEKIREYNTILKQLRPSGNDLAPADELTRAYLAQVEQMKRINRAREALSPTGRRRAEEGKSGRNAR